MGTTEIIVFLILAFIVYKVTQLHSSKGKTKKTVKRNKKKSSKKRSRRR